MGVYEQKIAGTLQADACEDYSSLAVLRRVKQHSLPFYCFTHRKNIGSIESCFPRQENDCFMMFPGVLHSFVKDFLQHVPSIQIYLLFVLLSHSDAQS